MAASSSADAIDVEVPSEDDAKEMASEYRRVVNGMTDGTSLTLAATTSELMCSLWRRNNGGDDGRDAFYHLRPHPRNVKEAYEWYERAYPFWMTQRAAVGYAALFSLVNDDGRKARKILLSVETFVNRINALAKMAKPTTEMWRPLRQGDINPFVAECFQSTHQMFDELITRQRGMMVSNTLYKMTPLYRTIVTEVSKIEMSFEARLLSRFCEAYVMSFYRLACSNSEPSNIGKFNNRKLVYERALEYLVVNNGVAFLCSLWPHLSCLGTKTVRKVEDEIRDLYLSPEKLRAMKDDECFIDNNKMLGVDGKEISSYEKAKTILNEEFVRQIFLFDNEMS